MLTQDQITAGTAVLSSGKLTAQQIDGLVSGFRMFFGDLETKYGYDWRTKLTALDDNADAAHTAAQVAACFVIMQELGFGVGMMDGGRDAIKFKEKDEYWQYIAFIHSKFYAIPVELSSYSLARGAFRAARSSSANSVRVEPSRMDIVSERDFRRRARRIW
jgi:hypothetical protein